MKRQFLAIFLLIGSTLLAQPDKAKLDAYFQALETNNRFMGNVLFSKDGMTAYSKSIGFADVANQKELNIQIKFRIGSITKMFTAVLVFKAVEQKKLSLGDKLEKWFPSVPNASKITIAQMLSHRSGIHNFTNDSIYTSYMTARKSPAELIDIISRPPSDFEPDSKAEYSNSNFVLLTFIVEKVFKKNYAELLTANITKPLRLKDTYYGGIIDPAKNEAISYQYNRGWIPEPQTDMSIPAGAGAIVSNVVDLSTFIEALFAGRLVSAESLAQMKIMRDGYGMGMFEVTIAGKKGFGHNGGIDGFTSMLAYFPDDHATFALTSNGSMFNHTEIATATLDWFNGKPVEIPEFKTYSYKNTTEDLDALLGTYASDQIPVKITITKDGTTLIAQGSGQSAFALDAAEKNVFRFDAAGIILEFNPAEKKMVLKQGGGVFNFTRK